MIEWIEKKWFVRFLEILPGFLAWFFILSPFIFSSIAPTFLAIFILIYSFFWLSKSLNIGRHQISGFMRLNRNMKTNWLELCEKTKEPKELEKFLKQQYMKKKSIPNWEDLLFVQNLGKNQSEIKDWEKITHVVIFAVSNERLPILEPSVKGLLNCNYPKEKMMVVFACEDRFRETIEADMKVLDEKYGKEFKALRWYWHMKKEGEVIGKGPNITAAGRGFWQEFSKELDPENVLVTNLDGDHIVHKEYFGRLTYLYVLDPNRDHKSYQPIPLLFNNIWDAPPMNRLAAITSSFWQIVEGMRPYRLRTFAAHTQSMDMLLKTDFWSVETIVEDGHQYWRTYFALNGDHSMVPMYIPVYQDAVLGESFWIAFKNQYKQKRRWAWGVSDFPFVVINCIKHKEIPLYERLLQIFRQFSGGFSWSTASFFLAGAWIPLTFNRHFQDTVIAHNIAFYSSQMLRFAWVGIIFNIWISLVLAPPKPKKYGLRYDLEMIFQWILSPPYAIILSALPALESQTRLLLGKKMEVFWITPKIRKHEPKFAQKEEIRS